MKTLLTSVCFYVCFSVFAQAPFSLQDRSFLSTTSPFRKQLSVYLQLEESTGPRYDRGPNGNHFSPTNTVGQAAGKVGNCATFSGTQYLSSSPNSSLWMTNTAFSVSLWCYPTNLTADMQLCGQWDYGINQRAWCLYYSASANQIAFYVSHNGLATTNALCPTTLVASNWYHVVGVYDRTNASIIVNNGTPVLAAWNNGIFGPAARVCIACGLENSVPKNFWKGSIDEFALWKIALTSTEVSKLYNLTKGTTWPMFFSAYSAAPIIGPLVDDPSQNTMIDENLDTIYTD